jgi:minor histocompatibility antigen H13
MARFDYYTNFIPRKFNITLLEFFSLLLSGYFSFLYVNTNFWVANNVYAICFAIYAIENWLVGSFRTVFVLFAGLIVYDMSFTFGSDIMVSVAEQIHIPIKILTPVSTKFVEFSLIGLGDVVIPGLFISMCLRHDLITTF